MKPATLRSGFPFLSSRRELRSSVSPTPSVFDLNQRSSPVIARDRRFDVAGSVTSSTAFGAEAPKRRNYFFFRFAVLRTVFLAADFVFVFAFAFFAMLPS